MQADFYSEPDSLLDKKKSSLNDLIKREPLIHFLGLTLLLFMANAYLEANQREEITVDTATQEFLINQQQDLLLRELTEKEKNQIIQSFVEDEILVREARKRGFNDSSRIRMMLIQNMRFFYKSDLPDPTDDMLNAYFEDNIHLFESPASISYQQVYFENADTMPVNTLNQLRSGVDHTTMGDMNLNFSHLAQRVSQKQIAQTFSPQVAKSIINIQDRLWHGPYESPFGFHYLRIVARHPRSRPVFEHIKPWVKHQWHVEQQQKVMDAALVELKQNYRINILTSVQQSES